MSSYTTTNTNEDGIQNVGGIFQIGGVAVTASASEINQACKTSTKVGVAAGSTLAVTKALHNGTTINLDTLTGSVCTLPAASGSGAKFRFLVTVLATSASHIVKVANSSDTMIGLAFGARVDSGNAALGFAAQATSDTITLNRTTTGSVSLGEWVEVTDVATNLWSVSASLTATGAAFATPFSATV
jgi:hypothetical protein